MKALPRKARQHWDKSGCVLPWRASPRLKTEPWYPSSGCVREVVGNRKTISVRVRCVKLPFFGPLLLTAKWRKLLPANPPRPSPRLVGGTTNPALHRCEDLPG
jgi:hypothetical protein